MRIAIYGTGGAGGYFGARLAKAGEDVSFIARGAHLAAIRTDGLHVEVPDGALLIHPAKATDRPDEIGPVDVVLLGVKAWQVDEAAAAMRPMIGPETYVVPLQNGVEAPRQLAAALGREHVVGGLCQTFSWVTGPGRIRSIGGINVIRFGELDNRPSARTQALRDAFLQAGVKVEIPADIEKALWEKFMLVSSFGGVGALSRSNAGVLRALPETRALMARCIDEVIAVGRAHGVALTDAALTATLAVIDAMAEGSTTSLQRDIADGKRSELEAWNGAVVRLGREKGVPTPAHETIHALLLPQEMRAAGR